MNKLTWILIGLGALLVGVAFLGYWLGSSELVAGALFGASATTLGALEVKRKVEQAEKERQRVAALAEAARAQAAAALQQTTDAARAAGEKMDEVTEEVVRMSDESKRAEGERLFGGSK